jgi:membrane fusion protein, multidrug efflux system
VLRGAAAGRLPAQREGVPVNLVLGDGRPYPYPGTIDYVDPTIEPTRGTVAVRAIVPNPDALLKPGEFVRVVVVFPDVQNAVLVPQRAVLDQQGGTYVLVVKPDGVVEQRQVALGAAHQGMQQIADGLVSGEQVIVDGVQKARAGQKVVAKEAPPETKAPTEAEAPAAGAPAAAPAPAPSPPNGSPAARPSASAG